MNEWELISNRLILRESKLKDLMASSDEEILLSKTKCVDN